LSCLQMFIRSRCAAAAPHPARRRG
jgi:hypothetical protein